MNAPILHTPMRLYTYAPEAPMFAPILHTPMRLYTYAPMVLLSFVTVTPPERTKRQRCMIVHGEGPRAYILYTCM